MNDTAQIRQNVMKRFEKRLRRCFCIVERTGIMIVLVFAVVIVIVFHSTANAKEIRTDVDKILPFLLHFTSYIHQ